MIPCMMVKASHPHDRVGWFDPDFEDALHQITLQFMRNGIAGAQSFRYAFNEIVGGKWYEDHSEC